MIMDMKDVITTARALAMDEISRYGTPKAEHFEISFRAGQRLAELLQADRNIVALGTILMDLKIGECLQEGKIEEHVARSAAVSREFLAPLGLPVETVAKIISCVESHHGREKYDCPEAEICANADCYRFLTPAGIFNYLILLGQRSQDGAAALDQLEYKVEEKHNALSLEICKKELEPYYLQFKDLLAKARQGI